MRHTGNKLWMPDSWNGGDITFILDKNTVVIEIERGMKDFIGATKSAKFKIAISDVQEFIMGLSALCLPPTGKDTP